MRINSNANIEFKDLLDYNDPLGTSFEIESNCGISSGIQVNSGGVSFRIFGISLGEWSFCYKAKYPNGTFGLTKTVSVLVLQNTFPFCNNQNSCQLNCYGTFNDFTTDYYADIITDLPALPFFSGTASNTVDVYSKNGGTDKVVSFQYTGNIGMSTNVQEFVIVPLNTQILPGCTRTLSMNTSVTNNNPSVTLNSPRLSVLGVSDYSSCNITFPWTPCPTFATCGLPMTCLATIDISQDNNFTLSGFSNVNDLNLTSSGVLSITNSGTSPIKYLFIIPSLAAGANSLFTRFWIDDLIVTDTDCPYACNTICPSITNLNPLTLGLPPLGFCQNSLTSSGINVTQTNQCINIFNQWNIDGGKVFTLNNCQVTMGEGAEIIVQSGSTLKLRGNNSAQMTRIQGCTKMWKGITIKSGGTLDADLSTIQDAQYAINLEDGATLKLTNSILDKNYVDIYTAPNLPTKTIKVPNLISGNTFKCAANLLPIYSGQLSNAYSTKTFAGVLIDRTVGLDLTGTGNVFEGILNGVIAETSTITVSNATIKNLINTNSVGITIGNKSKGVISNCTIKNTGTGIFVKFSDISITNCPEISTYSSLANLNTKNGQAIDILYNYLRKTTVSGNPNVKGARQGIRVENSLVLLGSNITNNKVTLFGNSLATNAIEMSNCINFIVKDNFVDDGANGFNYTGLNLYRCISNNFVSNHFLSLKRGLFDQSGSKNYFFGNEVIKSMSAGAKSPILGFEVLASSDKFCCNKIDKLTGDGFFFDGQCSQTSFRQSSINASAIGLHLAKDAIIGSQNDARNKWIGPFSSGFGAQHKSFNPSFITQSIFTKSAPRPQFKTEFGINSPNWFDNQPGGNQAVCNDCPDPTVIMNAFEPDVNTSDTEIANNGILGSDFDNSFTWMAKLRLFEKLRQNPSLVNSQVDLSSFYNTNQSQAIGQFNAVAVSIENLLELDQANRNQLASNATGIFDAMENLNILRMNNQFSQNALNHLSNSFDNAVSFSNWISNNQSAAKTGLLVNNNNLSNVEIWQSNERTLNRIILENELWNSELVNPTATAELKIIADQCPHLGGNAVFGARGYYSRTDPSIVWNDDFICATVAPHQGLSKERVPMMGWVLFPNPASDFLSITNESINEGHSSITIQNILGVLDNNLTYIFEGNQFDLNTSDWPSGFYTYTITEESGLQYSGKVIISHL